MKVFEAIKQKLDAAGIAYHVEHHEPTRTSEDAARIRGVALHSGAKAIVVTGEKTHTYTLFVMPADLRLDSKKVRALLGESVSFAQDVEAVTGCVPGSVPPFGSIIGLKTYVDQRLADNLEINFNAGSLTDSIRMRYDEYLRIEQPSVMDIVK